MKLDSAHLELLAALAIHDTMSAASQHINLSPSAASRRLQDAERRLGIRLVSLEGRSLELTAAGRLLADTATRTFHEVERAELAVQWFTSGDPAPVSVGVGFFDQIAWLLPGFDRYPVEIIRSPSAQASDAPDAPVTIDVLAHPTPQDRVLLVDDLVCVASTNHPLSRQSRIEAVDLESHRYFASRPQALPGFELEAFFLPAGHGPQHITRTESFGMVAAFISEGHGVSIQPARAIHQLKRTDLATVPLASPVEVAWCARQHSEDPRINEFLDALVHLHRED